MDSMKEWTRVESKLPDRLSGYERNSDRVLICNMGNYHIAFFDYNLRVWHVNADLSLPWDSVTHWILLPEMPKYSLNKNRVTRLVIAGQL